MTRCKIFLVRRKWLTPAQMYHDFPNESYFSPWYITRRCTILFIIKLVQKRAKQGTELFNRVFKRVGHLFFFFNSRPTGPSVFVQCIYYISNKSFHYRATRRVKFNATRTAARGSPAPRIVDSSWLTFRFIRLPFFRYLTSFHVYLDNNYNFTI